MRTTFYSVSTIWENGAPQITCGAHLEFPLFLRRMSI